MWEPAPASYSRKVYRSLRNAILKVSAATSPNTHYLPIHCPFSAEEGRKGDVVYRQIKKVVYETLFEASALEADIRCHDDEKPKKKRKESEGPKKGGDKKNEGGHRN